jgi:hypothetical protein
MIDWKIVLRQRIREDMLIAINDIKSGEYNE